MRVWLVEIGEPLPIDGGAPRLMRTGLLARAFRDAGHQVVWWASRFDHGRREQRAPDTDRVEVDDAFAIELLKGAGYSTSVGIRRLFHHRFVAGDFRSRITLAERPDLIICCVPTLELAAASVQYGRRNGVPVVLDLRDLWPDIFAEIVPKALRPAVRLLSLSAKRSFAKTCRDASGLLGITEEFLTWGLAYAGRERNTWDAVVHHAYPELNADAVAIEAAGRKWDALGIREGGEFVVTFVGTLSRRLTRTGYLQDAVDAVHRLCAQVPKVKLVVCGGGDALEHWKAVARGVPNLVVPGRVGHDDLAVLLSRTSLGLVPYPSTPDFARSIPNKVGEYLSKGVPVISTVDGALSRFLRENSCGVTYVGGNSEQLAGILQQLNTERSRLTEFASAARAAYERHLAASDVYRLAVERLATLVHAAHVGRPTEPALGHVDAHV